MKEKEKHTSTWLRYLVNFWTVVAFGVIALDFIDNNTLEYIIGPVLATYVGALVVYSAEKEFERWAEYYEGRHPGEWYVIGWTILIFLLVVSSLFVHNDYHLPAEVVSAYIAVISIMAFTKKSKTFFTRRGQI